MSASWGSSSGPALGMVKKSQWGCVGQGGVKEHAGTCIEEVGSNTRPLHVRDLGYMVRRGWKTHTGSARARWNWLDTCTEGFAC